MRSQRGGDSAGVERKGRGEDREGNDDRRDRLDVLNRGWRRNVGRTPGPQTALQWALAGMRPSRAEKRWAQALPKRGAKRRRTWGFHVPTEAQAAKVAATAQLRSCALADAQQSPERAEKRDGRYGPHIPTERRTAEVDPPSRHYVRT